MCLFFQKLKTCEEYPASIICSLFLSQVNLVWKRIGKWIHCCLSVAKNWLVALAVKQWLFLFSTYLL